MALLTIRLTRTPFSSTYSSPSSDVSPSIPSISGITISRLKVVEVTLSITSWESDSPFDSASLCWDGRIKKEMSPAGCIGSSVAGWLSSIHSGRTILRVCTEDTTSSESRKTGAGDSNISAPGSSFASSTDERIIFLVVLVRLTILLTRTPFSSIYSSTSSGDSSSDCVEGNWTSTGPIPGPSLLIVEVVMLRFTILLTRTPFSSTNSSTFS